MKQALMTVLSLCAAASMAACGGGSYDGGTATGGTAGGGGGSGGGTDGGTGGTFANSEEFFAARVSTSLDFCRTCHVPGGVADVPEGERFVLATPAQVSANPMADYALLNAAWVALGRGVEDNMILVEPSDAVEPHSGGKPWPLGSNPYENMKVLLTCWNDPVACVTLLGGIGDGGGGGIELPPLLGNPGKHFFVNQLCDDAPDATPINWNDDPRRMLLPEAGLIDSEQYAVHFNDPYEICHTETLFENQARQNELRIAQGLDPIYTAKRDPATCGEWRAAIKRGHDWIAMSPTDSPSEGGHGDSQFAALGALYGAASATAWNDLWKVWGMPGRPENFDEHVFERYGHTPPPGHIHNPYPLPGEETRLSETFGGSGRLPLGWAQGRDAEGQYNGQVALNCFSCHAGQIGEGEIASRDGRGNAASYGANATGSFMGLPNTNTELGVLIADLINAQQYQYGADSLPARLPAFGYIPLVNTTRGTNAADTEIEAIVLIRDFDTLNFSHVLSYPLHASMGDQDPPAWWWLSNKTRYLWFGGHSTDSSRGNMYFGSVNGLSGDQVKQNEGIFEDVHQWTLTLEAPSYPGPIDTALAEQGAILFHEKNLWADGENADIPQPKGNGSCAGCHGAYSPRYVNDTRFLPSPKLAGTVGYTVPIEIINTDPAQAEGWAMEIREHVSTFWWSYPDAQPDYLMPENKDPLTELLDDYAFLGIEGSDLGDHLGRNLDRMGALQPLGDGLGSVLGPILDPVPDLGLGEMVGRIKGACGFEEKTVGYVTPPLHGVWASAPYFHNGSVPNVWSVLKPSDRPTIWRRQRSTTPVHFNAFETRLTGDNGAYDFAKLGWKYDSLQCDSGNQGIPYYTCQPQFAAPQEALWVADTILGGLVWPTWVVPPPVGEQGLEDRMIFNTNMYSKKNRGHEWTQTLTDQERLALMEYLKTL